MMFKKITAFFITLAMAVSLLPAFTPDVSAADETNKRKFMLGTSALQNDRSFYYGEYEDNPIEWTVVSTNGNGFCYNGSTKYTPHNPPETPADNTVYTDTDGTRYIYCQ